MSALDKPSCVHEWKYRLVYVKKVNGEWTTPIWKRQGPNKTSNKPRATPRKKEMATINYFHLIDSVHPQSRKTIKVPANWLPWRVLFSYGCFLWATELSSAIYHGKLIVTLLIWSTFLFANLTYLMFACCIRNNRHIAQYEGQANKERDEEPWWFDAT